MPKSQLCVYVEHLSFNTPYTVYLSAQGIEIVDSTVLIRLAICMR